MRVRVRVSALLLDRPSTLLDVLVEVVVPDSG